MIFLKKIYQQFLSIVPIVIGIVICIVTTSSSLAQTPKKIKELSFGKIENVSVDRLGNLFLIFENTNIKKYDANMKLLAEMHSGKNPTLMEPWFHPKIFSYFHSTQQVVFYDHNLRVTEAHAIEPSVAISPLLVCPTNDNNLLVLDEADWSIKKVNEDGSTVSFEFILDTAGISKPMFTHMQEYQSLIFLLDKNSGIYVFNALGKQVNHIQCKVKNFGFFGEELFYLSDNKVKLFDLFTEKTREVKIQPCKFVIVTDERIFLVKENNKLVVYEFISEKMDDDKPQEK